MFSKRRLKTYEYIAFHLLHYNRALLYFETWFALSLNETDHTLSSANCFLSAVAVLCGAL